MHIMLYHCYTVLQINDAEEKEIDLKRFVGLAIAWFLYGVCPPVYLAITVFTFSLCTPTSVARLKSTAWKTWQNAFFRWFNEEPVFCAGLIWILTLTNHLFSQSPSEIGGNKLDFRLFFVFQIDNFHTI